MPAFTTVPGKATGDTISETNWDTHIAQNLNLLGNPPRCFAYHNAAQSIVTATDTAVALNSEFADTAALHDTVTNNSRITIPTGEGGWWVFTGRVEFASSATGQRKLMLRLNGTTEMAGIQVDAAAGSSVTKLNIALLLNPVAGDYLELVVSQNSGGSLNLSASPYFTAQRVA